MTPIRIIRYCAIIEEGTEEDFRQCLLRLHVAPAGPLYAHATLVVPPRSVRRIIGQAGAKPRVVDMLYE